MSQVRKLVITIECLPKEGKGEKLNKALWKAIEKYTTRKGSAQSLHTKYIYEGDNK